jgi:hypothetical protein
MQLNPRIIATPHRSFKKRKSLGTYGWVLLLLKEIFRRHINCRGGLSEKNLQVTENICTKPALSPSTGK